MPDDPPADLPRAEDCTGEGDLGRLHHDAHRDIWYECIFDSRRSMYTWSAIPPSD